MQECYYELNIQVNGAEVIEVVSGQDSSGRKLDGVFKKTFAHLGERNLFEYAAQNYIDRVGDRIEKESVKAEFMKNCTATENKFGLDI